MTTPSATLLMEYSEMFQASYLDFGGLSVGDPTLINKQQVKGARINLRINLLHSKRCITPLHSSSNLPMI